MNHQGKKHDRSPESKRIEEAFKKLKTKNISYEENVIHLIRTFVAHPNFGYLTDKTVDELLTKPLQSANYCSVSTWNAIFGALSIYVPLNKFPQMINYLQYSLAMLLDIDEGEHMISGNAFRLFVSELHRLNKACKMMKDFWIMCDQEPPQDLPIQSHKVLKDDSPECVATTITLPDNAEIVDTFIYGHEAKILYIFAMLIDLVAFENDSENLLFVKGKYDRPSGFEMIQVTMNKLFDELEPIMDTIIGNEQQQEQVPLNADQLAVIEALKMGLTSLMRSRHERPNEGKILSFWTDVREKLSQVEAVSKQRVIRGFIDHHRPERGQQKAISGLKNRILQFVEFGDIMAAEDASQERVAAANHHDKLTRRTARHQDVFESFPKTRIAHGTFCTLTGNNDVSYHTNLLRCDDAWHNSDSIRCVELSFLTPMSNGLVGFTTRPTTEEMETEHVNHWDDSVLLNVATGELHVFETVVPTNFSIDRQNFLRNAADESTNSDDADEVVVTMMLDQRLKGSIEKIFEMIRFLVNGLEVKPQMNNHKQALVFRMLEEKANLQKMINFVPVVAPANGNDVQIHWGLDEMKHLAKVNSAVKPTDVLTSCIDFEKEKEEMVTENDVPHSAVVAANAFRMDEPSQEELAAAVAYLENYNALSRSASEVLPSRSSPVSPVSASVVVDNAEIPPPQNASSSQAENTSD